MNLTSLYANGPARIEVGRYGLPPDDALRDFLAVAKDVGLPDPVITRTTQGINVNFYSKKAGHGFRPRQYAALLERVAIINDLHGDAPCNYDLIPLTTPTPGEYAKTGIYND